MKSQMKKTISILIGTVLFIALVHSDTYAQTNDFFARTIARDLVGKVITDPSQNYFTEDWILNRGEVLSVDIKQARNNGKKYAAIIIAHLKRGHLRVNAKMHVRYHYNGKRWVLTSTQVKLLNIPKQKDYSQYVTLREDYDFMPTLILKNKCDKRLFVRVELLDNDGKLKYMSVLAEPYKDTCVCVIVPRNYRIVYAYQK